MNEQLDMLTSEGAPAVWPCPTCRGNRTMLRPLYPDEDGYPGNVLEGCRTCRATGTVDYNPDDHSEIPY